MKKMRITKSKLPTLPVGLVLDVILEAEGDVMIAIDPESQNVHSSIIGLQEYCEYELFDEESVFDIGSMLDDMFGIGELLFDPELDELVKEEPKKDKGYHYVEGHRTIFNNKATVVWAEEGEDAKNKCVASCSTEDHFDPVVGFAIAFTANELFNGSKKKMKEAIWSVFKAQQS